MLQREINHSEEVILSDLTNFFCLFTIFSHNSLNVPAGFRLLPHVPTCRHPVNLPIPVRTSDCQQDVTQRAEGEELTEQLRSDKSRPAVM